MPALAADWAGEDGRDEVGLDRHRVQLYLLGPVRDQERLEVERGGLGPGRMARVIVEESDRGLHRRRVVALGGTGCADPERTIPVVASVALLAELVGDVGAHATRVSRTESLDEIGEPAVGDPRVGLDGRAVREVASVVADRDAPEIRVLGGVVGEEGGPVLEILVVRDAKRL